MWSGEFFPEFFYLTIIEQKNINWFDEIIGDLKSNSIPLIDLL